MTLIAKPLLPQVPAVQTLIAQDVHQRPGRRSKHWKWVTQEPRA